MMLAALLLAAGQDPLARWTLTPSEVVIGQPITCVLDVTHAQGNDPVAPRIALDYAWEVIDGPRHEPTGVGSRVTWTVLALEPGEHAWPNVEVVLADGSHLAPTAGSLAVAPELAEGEDAAPPMPGFRTVDERTSAVRPRHLLLSLLLTIVGAVSFFVWRRRQPRGEDEPTELERFQGLTRGDAHASAFELSALVRAAAERHLGIAPPRQHQTDDEWLGGLRAVTFTWDGDTWHEQPRLDPQSYDDLQSVLGTCALTKFAGSAPSTLAIDELWRRVGGLLERLAAPPPAAGEEEST